MSIHKKAANKFFVQKNLPTNVYFSTIMIMLALATRNQNKQGQRVMRGYITAIASRGGSLIL